MKITINEHKLQKLIWKYFIFGKNDEPEDKTRLRIKEEIANERH